MYMLPHHRIPLSHMTRSGSQPWQKMLLFTTTEMTPQFNWLKVSKAAIFDSANSYFGVTGNTTLNRVGDRAEGTYDYWKVVAGALEGTAPTFSWNKTTN